MPVVASPSGTAGKLIAAATTPETLPRFRFRVPRWSLTLTLLAAATRSAWGSAGFDPPSPPGDPMPAVPLEDARVVAMPPSLPAAIEAILDEDPLDRIHFGGLGCGCRHRARPLLAQCAPQVRPGIEPEDSRDRGGPSPFSVPTTVFQTEVWATGSMFGQALDGDLVVLASGDPSMSPRFWESGEASPLRHRRFPPPEGDYGTSRARSSWTCPLGTPRASVPLGKSRICATLTGTTGGAFAIDEGEIRLVVSAGAAVGSPASISWRPRGYRRASWADAWRRFNRVRERGYVRPSCRNHAGWCSPERSDWVAWIRCPWRFAILCAKRRRRCIGFSLSAG